MVGGYFSRDKKCHCVERIKKMECIIAPEYFFIFTAGKMCNNPQLRDTGNFPDSVFSGQGDSRNKYKDARITRRGWCPLGSSSVYLLLDLQKEYHITGIVVMADKAQTKWSGSYSLKYGRNTSYKNYEEVRTVELGLPKIGTCKD